MYLITWHRGSLIVRCRIVTVPLREFVLNRRVDVV